MADSLRTEISGGKFASGTQLPSTRELAETWETSIFTVHTALKTLVREGWIDRRKGAGTYIADPKARFQSVGIYHDADISSEMQTSFSRNLHFSLLGRIRADEKRSSRFHRHAAYGRTENCAACPGERGGMIVASKA